METSSLCEQCIYFDKKYSEICRQACEEAEIIEYSDRFQCGCKDEDCIAWVEEMPVYLTRSGAIKDWNNRAYEEKNDADV